MDDANEQMACARLRIDLDAIAANYRLIREQVGSAAVAAVIKADAYGLGAVQVARKLVAASCRDFFVAHLMEATPVVPVLPRDARIFVLNGLNPGAEATCVRLGAIPVLNSLEQISRWQATARATGRNLPAALQVDTGMSRLGLPSAEMAVLAAEPERLAGIDVVLLMSHLACADEPEAAANTIQRAAFDALTGHFPDVPRSLDNSGGSFLDGAGHFDLVRCGIALYGGRVHEGRISPIQSVVALTAGIVQVRDVPVGAGVGYGLSFHASRPSRIATIGVGYADGWPRSLSNRGVAYIGGMPVPIAGRISMDSMTLDVTDVPPARLVPGAEVELLGPHQTINDVAIDAETIDYEVLTRLGRRYARCYQGDVA